ncbi:MAG: hypothetical protein JW825_04965 [Candidatus Methanofastidiosa archaeon]|nr:hypothetical protein [Candidatus Methanofastidiosa archaeon]
MACETYSHRILDILRDTYENSPPGYAGKIEIEHRLKIPANEFEPYLEELTKNGFVKKMEGPAPTFIVKFTPKGYEAYMNRQL